jgi:non-specific serine/threonine protein kinase
VKADLRPYQQRGVEFLAHAASLGLGAVLADDMGLGKTLQALVWLEHLRAAAPNDGPSLVVCPASVLHNWVREATRFVPSLRVLTLASGTSRHALRRELPECDLAVTTYALLRRDLDAWRALELRALILDEAQTIKNPDAIVTRAACALRARHRLALTGTPLESRGVPTHLLTGETTKRERVVQTFTDDARACVFLISLKAGGLGLNLTSASHVVLFDP